MWSAFINTWLAAQRNTRQQIREWWVRRNNCMENQLRYGPLFTVAISSSVWRVHRVIVGTRAAPKAIPYRRDETWRSKHIQTIYTMAKSSQRRRRWSNAIFHFVSYYIHSSVSSRYVCVCVWWLLPPHRSMRTQWWHCNHSTALSLSFSFSSLMLLVAHLSAFKVNCWTGFYDSMFYKRLPCQLIVIYTHTIIILL